VLKNGAVDGVHDLGGRQGFGRVLVEPDEPVFHQPWEATVWGLTNRAAIVRNTPEFRHAIERMDPVHYLTSSYYEHWLTAIASLAVERGLVTRQELEDRAEGPFPLSGPVRAEPIEDPGPDAEHHRFGLGQAVRVRRDHPPGHTRCPGYIRGLVGVVIRHDPVSPVPDVEAHSTSLRREPTYCVRFSADELWQDGQPGVSVHVDLWESYLEDAG
jgi:nitrile hydratase beta subunit